MSGIFYFSQAPPPSPLYISIISCSGNVYVVGANLNCSWVIQPITQHNKFPSITTGTKCANCTLYGVQFTVLHKLSFHIIGFHNSSPGQLKQNKLL